MAETDPAAPPVLGQAGAGLKVTLVCMGSAEGRKAEGAGGRGRTMGVRLGMPMNGEGEGEGFTEAAAEAGGAPAAAALAGVAFREDPNTTDGVTPIGASGGVLPRVDPTIPTACPATGGGVLLRVDRRTLRG